MLLSGESWALAAALAYGLAGVSIAKGKASARGDNGVYLSCVVTAVIAGLIWLGSGPTPVPSVAPGELWLAVLAFLAAGVFSTVLGRVTLYRATEALGAVTAGLLRRLTPFFALAFGWLLLREVPGRTELMGGAMILAGVVVYLARPMALSRGGVLLGVGSAAAYALAYSLRGMGLEHLPDPGLGALIGALVGCVWFPCAALLRRDRVRALSALVVDRGGWHWLTALALGFGQVMQFFALKTASVAVVAVLGALDVLFALGFAVLLGAPERIAPARLLPALILALSGTAILFLF
ncbi:MAG: EamA family transporter [Rhodobacterales bacterium]|nr:MAG: EamA family transporter [Rhodobacterales bacterium]